MKIEDLEKVNILTQYINGIDDFIDKYNFNPKPFTIESGHFAIDIIKEQGHEIKNALEKIKSNLIEQLKELGVEVNEHIEADNNTASITKKKEYPEGIVLPGKYIYDNQIWYLEKKESTETKLQYYGYDACVFPLPKLSKTSKKNQNRVLGNMGNKLKDVNMEIWLDDIRLKRYKGE